MLNDCEYMSIEKVNHYRMHSGKLREKDKALKQDIKKHGVLKPLEMYYNPDAQTILLVEGNHRLTIAQELGYKKCLFVLHVIMIY